MHHIRKSDLQHQHFILSWWMDIWIGLWRKNYHYGSKAFFHTIYPCIRSNEMSVKSMIHIVIVSSDLVWFCSCINLNHECLKCVFKGDSSNPTASQLFCRAQYRIAFIHFLLGHERIHVHDNTLAYGIFIKLAPFYPFPICNTCVSRIHGFIMTVEPNILLNGDQHTVAMCYINAKIQ